jgi:hypothetical protein
MLVSLLNVAVFSTVAEFPILSHSGGLAVYIHDVPYPIVPAVAAISDVVGVSSLL